MNELGSEFSSVEMPTTTYRDELSGVLTDPVEAGEYLAACFHESDEAFLLGLRHVVGARGGMSQLAAATGLSRESLYRTLSPNGNPQLSTLRLIVRALGLQLSFVAPGRGQGQGAVR
ncbi:MAG: putative addiction module antidote protein [Myxococcales bacterium]|nr:MAG: putative addiction module antidote protein [Myxococcales bacterium]